MLLEEQVDKEPPLLSPLPSYLFPRPLSHLMYTASVLLIISWRRRISCLACKVVELLFTVYVRGKLFDPRPDHILSCILVNVTRSGLTIDSCLSMLERTG